MPSNLSLKMCSLSKRLKTMSSIPSAGIALHLRCWNLSMKKEDWKYLGIRHPSTLELFVHARMPFGWKDAPREACAVSEALMAEMRRRGVKGLVFVDDFLLFSGSN